MLQEVAKLTDFGDSRICAAVVNNTPVVLVLAEDGSVSALEDRCSHADFALSDGSYEEGEITCPAHGARFDVKTGAALCMPAFRPVKTFPCRLDQGVVYVDVEG